MAIDARPLVWYRGTGIGSYTRDLLAYLPAAAAGGAERYLVLWPEDAPAPRLAPGWAAVPMPRRRERERLMLSQWLARESVDVYHAPQNGMRAPGDLGRTKLVITVHDLIPLVLPETVRHGYCRRFLREVPDAVERASAVITVSCHTASDISRLLGARPDRLRVVPAAPDPALRPVAAGSARQLIRTKYGVDEPYILYVGGLNPRKNVADLIYAYSKVCRGLWPELVLVIAGESLRHGPPLRELVHALGIERYVHWPGHVADADLAALYSAAEFLVYPSLYEGFGLPPIEAMACGTPVLCSDAASLPEVVGRAAVTVPSGDVTALAAAIGKLAGDPDLRGRLGRRGIRRARRFSWPDAAAAIRQVYLEVATEEVCGCR